MKNEVVPRNVRILRAKEKYLWVTSILMVAVGLVWWLISRDTYVIGLPFFIVIWLLSILAAKPVIEKITK